MRRDERSPSRRQLVGEIMSALIGSGHGGDSTGLLVVVVRVLVQFLQWSDSTHTPSMALPPVTQGRHSTRPSPALTGYPPPGEGKGHRVLLSH